MNKAIKEILIRIPVVKKFINDKNILLKKISVIAENNYFLQNENNYFMNHYFNLNQLRYQYVIEKIHQKIKNKIKIRVAFFVMLNSTFSCKPLYEEMLKVKTFKPFIVVIPDISRGREYLNNTFNETYQYFSKKYKNVYKGYDINTKKFYDFSNKIDMVHLCRPYKGMSHKFFEIEYFQDKNILPFYISYSFSVTKFTRVISKSHYYDYFWKIFVPTTENLDELRNNNILNGKNALVTGYCKMDDLFRQKIIKRKRKLIIIAPHHTVSDWKLLHISNFLEYSNIILELPKLYPNIDFVFRPHPLLITQLKKSEIWGHQKTEKYLEDLKSNRNLVYSNGGEYFDIFVNSDGIIHDCGSFLAEYLFTGKPACYILKNREAIEKWFIPLGQKCLEQCYQAFSRKDILSYIDNVIINGEDSLKSKRLEFVNTKLKINYPHASENILNYIEKTLLESK